ncbi:MAG TPA: alpha/beta fold hydrolase [Candidatus Methylomirabilis sp.]|nr:alpha/beta fold hydrolase [Candidatus Methylomirabilis sp.]
MPQHALKIPVLSKVEGAAGGLSLAAVLHLPDAGQGPWPCVVASHGLLSSKDSAKYVQVADEFSRAGIAVCRVDFRGCGESPGSLLETTVAQRVSDLRATVEQVRRHPALSGRVALLGSSLGGYVSLFVASQDFKVKAVAAWATPANLDYLAERPDAARATGLGDAFLTELKEGRYRHAPVGTRFCLFVHGDRDEVVPVEHARHLHEAAFSPKRLEIIPGGNHQLTDPDHRVEALRLSLEWIRRYV